MGTALVHLIDADRAEPLDPAGGDRQLMVQVWYPAAEATGPIAPYATPGEAEQLQLFYPVPADVFTAETNSHVGAPVAEGPHPVVLFHHGLCGSRTDSTIVAEELASRGYVVVALGSTGESLGVEFPDGHVVTTSDPESFCAAASDPASAQGQEALSVLLDARVGDTTLVLDDLEAIAGGGAGSAADDAPWPADLGAALDLEHLGMYGHSFGGATTAAVMAADARVDAGVNLDGLVLGPVATDGLDRPFMVVGSSYHDPTFDPSWVTFLPALRGWARWFQVTDAGHYRFIDLGGSAHRWGLDTTLKSSDPETWTMIFGDISDETTIAMSRQLVTAFFDQHLLGEPRAILDNPAATFTNIVSQPIATAAAAPASTAP